MRASSFRPKLGVILTDQYQEMVQLIERLHRHFLDVIRAELRRLNVEDINAVQALLLHNVGTEDVVIRDLKDRGYYHGSNVSYNIKKLTETGYIAQERSAHDRRATRLRLTDKGLALCEALRAMQSRLAGLLPDQGLDDSSLSMANGALLRLERAWTDHIRFGAN
ncbi:transcriptional regulator, MarR family [Rhodospirillum rubrum ATCC 11170]|uniref:Transcriptional regulator, MarR family n=2 Tax=Rhodospirillum rubrum TaxID=1085 RepID=Q2RWH1_RHORT|nr:transcriptional regulator, MarR family [Rhodospirillum rubrum ATCC 11170]MBK5953121.1 MarR family transcriptional regulator [Rhodospirillum rubrum]QXG81197.1 MarR family transcriptional regulator [Rhodospirillum rubrum]